jgi:hypothetical protein
MPSDPDIAYKKMDTITVIPKKADASQSAHMDFQEYVTYLTDGVAALQYDLVIFVSIAVSLLFFYLLLAAFLVQKRTAVSAT